MTPRCDNCRFWDAYGEECHRYAPRAVPFQFFALCLALTVKDDEAQEIMRGDSPGIADFPKTRRNEWCGEHEPGEPR